MKNFFLKINSLVCMWTSKVQSKQIKNINLLHGIYEYLFVAVVKSLICHSKVVWYLVKYYVWVFMNFWVAWIYQIGLKLQTTCFVMPGWSPAQKSPKTTIILSSPKCQHNNRKSNRLRFKFITASVSQPSSHQHFFYF